MSPPSNHALLVLTDLGGRLEEAAAREIIPQLVDDPLVTDWSNRVPKRSGKRRARHRKRSYWPLASTEGEVTAIDLEPHARWLLGRLKADAATIERLTSLRDHLAICFYWTQRQGRGAPIPAELAAELEELDIWIEYELEY